MTEAPLSMKSLEEKISGQLLKGYQSKVAMSINGMNASLIKEDFGRARAIQNAGTRLLLAFLPDEPEVEVTTMHIQSDGAHIPVGIYHPVKATGNIPSLLWIHGGGMMTGSYSQNEAFLRYVSKTLLCKIVAVDYRLAPECPYPAAMNDCYAALQWMFESHQTLGLDPYLIAVGGASAGGNLAAALALRARDEGKIPLAHQLLIYPMLDDKNRHSADENHPDTPIWTRGCNQIGWSVYLGNLDGQENIPEYAAPTRAEDLSDLACATVIVGELDLFLDESIQYAHKLLKHGVSTALHVYPGAYHGFDFLALDSDIGQQCQQAVLLGLKSSFNSDSAN
jgi:acetyl esterase/lipase